jgi:transposase-like protein
VSKRQSFSTALKQEIAHGYVTDALSSKAIEARGIRMGNVNRWVTEIYGPGGKKAAKAKATANAPHVRLLERKPTEAPATSPADEDAPVDIRTLTKRQLKRGPNGRYSKLLRNSATVALRTMSIAEVSAITGVNQATLYLWKKPQTPTDSASPGTAVVPLNGVDRLKGSAPVAAKAELLINPASTEALLAGIRKSEGFSNLEKGVKQLKAAYRSGLIDDYDEIDLRILLGHCMLTGSGLRSRK